MKNVSVLTFYKVIQCCCADQYNVMKSIFRFMKLISCSFVLYTPFVGHGHFVILRNFSSRHNIFQKDSLPSATKQHLTNVWQFSTIQSVKSLVGVENCRKALQCVWISSLGVVTLQNHFTNTQMVLKTYDTSCSRTVPTIQQTRHFQRFLQC